MWWVKFITKNSSAQAKHTSEQQTTQEPLVITDGLQTQRGDTLKDKYVCGKGWLLSLAAGSKKEDGRAVLGNTENMHVAQIFFPLILVLARVKSQLKLTGAFSLRKKYTIICCCCLGIIYNCSICPLKLWNYNNCTNTSHKQTYCTTAVAESSQEYINRAARHVVRLIWEQFHSVIEALCVCECVL